MYRMCVCFECHWCISVWGQGAMGAGGRTERTERTSATAPCQCALKLWKANTRVAPSFNFLAKYELFEIEHHKFHTKTNNFCDLYRLVTDCASFMFPFFYIKVAIRSLRAKFYHLDILVFCTNAGLHRPSGMDIGTRWVSKPWH